jgi:hypothetical protein
MHMSNIPRIPRSQRSALVAVALLLLAFGASRVFSQAADPSATAPADPSREILLLKKTALEAEIKAATARVDQANRRIKNAEHGNRSRLQDDGFLKVANVDFLERVAVLARKRVELKEVTIQLEGQASGGLPAAGLVDVTDNLLRRIKDVEARVDKIEAAARGDRLRMPSR